MRGRGAHAVAFHGYLRATEDLDILYLQTEQNARHLAGCVEERLTHTPPISWSRRTRRDRDRVDADAIDDGES